MNKPTLPILLYDSECPMCTRFKEALDRLDPLKKVEKISIHEKTIYSQFPDLSEIECHQTVHLIDEDGQIHKGAGVINYLAHQYPGVAKIAWLLDTEVGQKTLNFFYDKLNDLRKQATTCPKCPK